jgi:hypothetical protein
MNRKYQLTMCTTQQIQLDFFLVMGGRCGRDHMVVGFTSTYAISAYHH